ncbi:MAG: hypothetical protein HZR80_19110 [Candidatus Heimdallarchaeota archaeon]
MIISNLELEKIIFDFVHKETGWGDPSQPGCEFEDLYIKQISELKDGKILVLFKYNYDEDGFSMYDRQHYLEGEVVLNAEGSILESRLEEVHTDPGCVEDPYKPKKNEP